MDFVERWLNVSPDGGNGSFEVGVILAVVILIGFLIFRRFHGAWAKRFRKVAWLKWSAGG
jgi:hypothetical protein